MQIQGLLLMNKHMALDKLLSFSVAQLYNEINNRTYFIGLHVGQIKFVSASE